MLFRALFETPLTLPMYERSLTFQVPIHIEPMPVFFDELADLVHAMGWPTFVLVTGHKFNLGHIPVLDTTLNLQPQPL